MSGVYRQIKALRQAAKIRNEALPHGRKYPIIYADPPWSFESAACDSLRAGMHYPCMSTEELCAMPVCQLATRAAALFLWVPAAILQKSFQVIEAWGFAYRTSAVWVKTRAGNCGYFFRNQHEHLLVGTRGDFPHPLPSARSPSVIHAPRREHSQKPNEAYALIEKMYPDLPRIELFARGVARLDWAVWGNQAVQSR